MPCRGICTTFFLAALAGFGLSLLTANAQQPAGIPPAQKQLGDVDIGNDAIGHSALKRDKAIDFALTQIAKLIDYVFLAALAMLGLVVKTCVFDRLYVTPTNPNVPPSQRAMIAAAIVSLGASSILGLFAFGYFPKLLTAASFSLNGSIGYLVFAQEITCGLGMAFVGILCLCRLCRS
jgi:hypothetical protein